MSVSVSGTLSGSVPSSPASCCHGNRRGRSGAGPAPGCGGGTALPLFMPASLVLEPNRAASPAHDKNIRRLLLICVVESQKPNPESN